MYFKTLIPNQNVFIIYFLGVDSFTGEFFQTFDKDITILDRFFQRIHKLGTACNAFQEAHLRDLLLRKT